MTLTVASRPKSEPNQRALANRSQSTHIKVGSDEVFENGFAISQESVSENCK